MPDRITTRGASRPGSTPQSMPKGTLIVDGFGCSLSVANRQLVVESVSAGRVTYSKATCRLRRVILIGNAGLFTLEAIRWLSSIGASLTHIDVSGEVFLTSVPRQVNDARLLRSQALAPFTDAGVNITRQLLGGKVRGQQHVLDTFGIERPAPLDGAHELIARATDVRDILVVESIAAAAYWTSLREMPVQFARADRNRVPSHWLTFGSRHSPLTNGPRLAATPANCLANYAYGILASEAAMSLRRVGLSESLGVFHSDQPNRDSLSLDVMEPVRPTVDAIVLDLLRRQTFRYKDFRETPDGSLRLNLRLATELSKSAPILAEQLAPVVEWVAKEFARYFLPNAGTITKHRAAIGVSTRLTQQKRSIGRDKTRAQIMPRCKTCGNPVPKSQNFCEACRPGERLPRFMYSGSRSQAEKRRVGDDPAHDALANEKRSATMQRRAKERAAYVEDGTLTEVDFERDIRSKLQGVSLVAIRRATGLSPRSCSLIRSGTTIPHRRHWKVLLVLVSSQ
jgi:CRISP-associated protein Cas1